MDTTITTTLTPLAEVEVIWNGHAATLPGGMDPETPNETILRVAAEAVAGGFPGMPADPAVRFDGFKVERYPANESRPVPKIQLRPSVPFGAQESQRAVWKFELALADLCTVNAPLGAQPLRVALQAGAPMLWCLVDPLAPAAPLRIAIAGTGHVRTDLVRAAYIDTFFVGPLVFHAFVVPE